MYYFKVYQSTLRLSTFIYLIVDIHLLFSEISHHLGVTKIILLLFFVSLKGELQIEGFRL